MFFLLITAGFAGPNTALLGFDHSQALPAVRAQIEQRGGAVRVCYQRAQICLLDFPAAPSEAALSELSALPGVRYIERDQLMPAVPTGSYSDPAGTTDCPDLWDLEAIGVGAAWTAAGGQGESAPVVAIQDSGFLLSHDDLSGRVSGQYDYGDWDSIPEVEYSVAVPAHGTFIAGVIAANDTNDVGRAGVIPQGQLNLQKIADSSGALYFSYAISAMADIAEGDLGVRVLSYSIAGSSTTDSFRDAVSALGDADILLVAAAGNCGSAHCADADNDSFPLYPASFTDEHIVSVAGSVQSGALNSYSHYGSWSVDLAAPGVDICSLGVDSDTDTYTAAGTSYATPLVAGVAALVMGAWPELTAVETARVLRASAADNADLTGLVRSGGVLSAERAMSTAVPRLEAPGDQIFAGETTLGLDLTNAAAAGEGALLLFHSAELELRSQDAGWSAVAFGPGDVLALPDAGEHTATSSGTLVTGELEARTTTTLALTMRAYALVDEEVSVRLVAASEGADYLNAPYDEGSEDETGFLGWQFSVVSTEIWSPSDTGDTAGDTDSEDTGHVGETGDTGPTPTDTEVLTDDTAPTHDTGGRDSVLNNEDDPKGCGCTATREGSGDGSLLAFFAITLLGAGFRRRLGNTR